MTNEDFYEEPLPFYPLDDLAVASSCLEIQSLDEDRDFLLNLFDSDSPQATKHHPPALMKAPMPSYTISDGSSTAPTRDENTAASMSWFTSNKNPNTQKMTSLSLRNVSPPVNSSWANAAGPNETDVNKHFQDSPPLSFAAAMETKVMADLVKIKNADPSRKRLCACVDCKRTTKSNLVYSFTDRDVFMGRGGRARHSLGNQWYLVAKTMLQRKYFSLKSRAAKTEISQRLVDAVYARGGRFLEKVSDGVFREVDSKRARVKASQALREVLPKATESIAFHRFATDVAWAFQSTL